MGKQFCSILTDYPPMTSSLNQQKIPAYRTRLKAERANKLYIQILNKLTEEKLYRNP